MSDLRHTGLYDFHLSQGAKMVPFAGWSMPVQYPMGVMAEHLHTRSHAGLFDVSHMGQILIHPTSGDVADAALALETLVPADLLGLAPGRQRYGMFTTQTGGILDDLMIANRGDHLYLVVNAGCADQDIAHLNQLQNVEIEVITDRALLALQGPKAGAILADLVPDVAQMGFMNVRILPWQGIDLWISRSGYTGEDGFEISVANSHVDAFVQALMTHPDVALIGLGARDSLRLEAGLPLYGQDMSPDISPAQAGLGWSIPKVRRLDGARAAGFPGADAVLAELAQGAATRRRGLRPEGRAPIREGVEIYDSPEGGEVLGKVTSGGFGPSVGGPIAMAMLPVTLGPDAPLWASLRGKRVPVALSALPFVTHAYKR